MWHFSPIVAIIFYKVSVRIVYDSLNMTMFENWEVQLDGLVS